MQAVYPSRIDWKDEPSTNTPLGANNLNKMDYALYELDKRVLTLGGYEERAALSATNAETSEINAKTSENNSKVSETNAKTSEINAKDYMERAYAATPEGYDELVETVRLMDIATTTESILEKSKPGGLKINHIVGSSEQNGTPTPSNPIGIKNVGDCVEMIQGYWRTDYSIDTTTNYIVCNKKPIPCKSGDDIQLKCDKTFVMLQIMWYADGVFMDTSITNNADSVSATIPSGATGFCFNVRNADSTTPLPLDTVGKISLTVNGKYVTPIKSHGKNFFDKPTITANVYTECFTFIPKGKYTLSADVTSSDTNDSKCAILMIGMSGTSYVQKITRGNRQSVTIDAPEDCYSIRFYASIDYANSVGDTFTFDNIQLELSETATEYEPYQETTAYIYTDEPIRDSDVVFNDNGVWKVERNRAVRTIDNSFTFLKNSGSEGDSNYLYYTKNVTDIVKDCDLLSTKLVNKPIYDLNGDNSIDRVGLRANGNGLIHLNIGYYLTENTASAVKTWFGENPIEIEYTPSAPTYETLDTASQIALNSLETFDTVTYIEVDSRVHSSEIKVEYGTSQVGAYTIKCMNDNDTDRVEREDIKARLDEMAVMIVAMGSEV